MSKRELINAILEHNHTAAPEFLAKFAENDLKAYLDRVAIVVPRRNTIRNPLEQATAQLRAMIA